MASLVGFIGKHDLRIDDKGRLTIPSRFKQVLKEKYPQDEMEVMVSISWDRNLQVQPISEYLKKAERVMSYNALDAASRRLQQMYTGMASQEKVDGSGRIRLAPDLREMTELDREVTCVGNLHSFEIWDRSKWQTTQEDTLRNREKLIEEVRSRQPD